MKLYTWIIAALLASSPAMAVDFEIKGQHLGEPTSASWVGERTFAGAKAHFDAFTDKHGKVEEIRVMFDSSNFKQVHDALVEKYGEPVKTFTTPMTNGFGARFLRIEQRWINDAGDTMQLWDHFSATGSGVVITSKKKLDAYAASEAKAKGDI